MAEITGIGWTDHTFNIAWGCEKVSVGCVNCYAERDSYRYGFDIWGPNKPRRTFGDKHWQEPRKWNQLAEAEGRKHRVFCSSMCDIFEDHPTIQAELKKLWPLIKETPMLEWQLLTKRPERILQSLPSDWPNLIYKHVLLGTSAENQEWWNKRVPILIDACPAKRCFVSAEPLIGPIDPGVYTGVVDWVIIGGESGKNTRGKTEWIVSLARKCVEAGTPVFVKQDSGLTPGKQGSIPDEVWKLKEFPE